MKIKYSLFTILFILYSCGEVENGGDGVSVLVNSEEEPVGDNCSTGGTKLTFGNDIDGDGTLDDNEITNTFYVCNGENGNDGSHRHRIGFDSDEEHTYKMITRAGFARADSGLVSKITIEKNPKNLIM